MKIGSHVAMSGKQMLVGSVNEALSYEATTFMFYTGAPQNTRRKAVDELNVEKAKKLMIENNIDIKDVVVHAPYIINIANVINQDTQKFAKEFLQVEIERVSAIGCEILVLHPGSHVKQGLDKGINKIIESLNELLDPKYNVKIALETMAGKGSEIGSDFSELASIIKGLKHPELIGVCLDTCHLHDSGYDLTDFDQLLLDFDNKIGLDKIQAVHINDSKNQRGAKKDRHENIGFGYIGFDTLNKIVHHHKLKDVPKILETPYIGEKAPYKLEIEMFRQQQFNPQLKELLLK